MEVFLNETYISNVHHLVVVECDDGVVSYTPQKKSNRSSHSNGRGFNAMLAYDCNSQKSLTR